MVFRVAGATCIAATLVIPWLMLARARVVLHDFLHQHGRASAPAILVFVAAALAFRWSHARIAYWGIDDAAITYAASLELVDHGSLAAYVEGPPIEGYSNPIVFFVFAVLRLVGLFDPVVTHAILECLLFGVMVLLVHSLLRSSTGAVAAIVGATAFATLELANKSTWLWYASGLENVWVSTGLVALLWLCVRTARGRALNPAWGSVAFLVAISRPEGPVYVAAFFAALFLFARPRELALPKHARQVARGLAVTIALYLAFLAWRRIGYGDWWPNTYYAKLGNGSRPLANLTGYVIPIVFTYQLSGALAASVVPAWLMRVRIAPVLAIFLIASLTMAIMGGNDWMGWHRFCTPFFAMTHVAYATLAASVVEAAKTLRGRWRPAPFLAIAAVLALPASLAITREPHRRWHLPVNARDVTIAAIARWEGALRWEQQVRVGVPNAVVMMPDAGGTGLVGGMQLLDNGALTDFQMARTRDPRLVSQYQNQERRPDLVRDDPWFPHDPAFLREHYLLGDPVTTFIGGVSGAFWIRRDLVELSAIDSTAQLVYDDGALRLYLSAETVPFSAPRALVRCELFVVWAGAPDDDARVRMTIEGGDRDQIALRPYAPPPDPTGPAGGGPSPTMQRRGLLLGAPDRAGAHAASLEVIRAGAVKRIDGVFTLTVATDDVALERAAGEIAGRSSPIQGIHRIGRLREQLVPRLGMTAFRESIDELGRAHTKSSRSAGREILRLRSNARLAAHADLPVAIRRAEAAAVRRYLATCPASSDDGGAADRVLCIGRAVDELRRHGYFGVLSLVPEIDRELDAARERLSSWPAPQQYRALVGLTLAVPSDLALQRRLLARRHTLAGSLPAL